MHFFYFPYDIIAYFIPTLQGGHDSRLFEYRATGIQVHGDLAGGKVYYALMLANPKTASGLFTPTIKYPVYNNRSNGLMVWGRVEIKPVKGLSVGAFLGSSKENEYNDEYSYNSHGGHLIYTKDKINFKAEYVEGKYDKKYESIKYDGFYVVLGYRINKKIEPVIRFDSYTPVKGSHDDGFVESYNNISIGLNYFFSKHIKIQANYILRDEKVSNDDYSAAAIGGILLTPPEKKNNIFYMNFQYSF